MKGGKDFDELTSPRGREAEVGIGFCGPKARVGFEWWKEDRLPKLKPAREGGPSRRKSVVGGTPARDDEELT